MDPAAQWASLVIAVAALAGHAPAFLRTWRAVMQVLASRGPAK